MNNFLAYRYIGIGIGTGLALELASFLQFFIPTITTSIGIVAIIIFFFFAYHHYYYALTLLFIELVLSGHGFMLQIELGSTIIAMRHVWYAILLLLFIFHYRDNLKKIYLRYSIFTTLVVALTAIVLFSSLLGYLSGNSLNDIYHDANAYAFLFLIFPLVAFPYAHISKLVSGILGGIIVLSLKTLLVMTLFSFDSTIVPGLYIWIRDLRIGEITPIGFSFFRVFLQSQIFIAFALFLIIARVIGRYFSNSEFLIKEKYILATLAVLFTSSLLVSFSRSFFLGFCAAFIVTIIYFIRIKILSLTESFKIIRLASGVVLVSLVVVFLLLSDPFSGTLVSDRFNVFDEPSIQSRLALISPMVNAIRETPVFGSGFGTTLTYLTSDPRILNQGNEVYTTYAFEWGWLDVWLKLGFIGLILFFVYFYRLIFNAKKQLPEFYDPYRAAIIPVTIFLFIVHIFTPYLNHPIGISMVFLLTLFLKRGVTQQSFYVHDKTQISAEVFSLRVVRIGARSIRLVYPR